MTWTWRKIGVVIGAALVVLFALGTIMDQLILPSIVSMTDTINVPGVVGKDLATAQQMVTDAGLQVMETREQYSAAVRKGIIMSQLPYAHATVKEGRRIYLTVSKGIETVRVPSLYGHTVRDARLTLMRLGLQLGEVTYQSDEDVAVDHIATQGIPAGAEIPNDGIISVVVSRGSSGVRVPSLVGLSLEEAQDLLLDAGLTIGSIVEKASGAFDSGVVLAHDPPADSSVVQGTAVMMVVARP